MNTKRKRSSSSLYALLAIAKWLIHPKPNLSIRPTLQYTYVDTGEVQPSCCNTFAGFSLCNGMEVHERERRRQRLRDIFAQTVLMWSDN